MSATRTNGRPSLDDYIDVAERIAAFDERYPEGSLQTIEWSTEQIGEHLFIVYRAAAYRTPDDRRPGHGTAWEPFPGRTPYTKDSELMNAETAAWGRAIVACGLTSNRKIASRQEVQARAEAPAANGTRTAPQPIAAPPKPSERHADGGGQDRVRDSAREAGLVASELANIILTADGHDEREFADEGAAERWVKRAIDRLPARLVDTVIAGIEGGTQR